MSGPDPSGALHDLLTLTFIRGLGPQRIMRLLERLGSARAALAATASQLQEVPGIGPALAAGVISGRDDARLAAERELTACARQGVRVLARNDEAYPPLLRELPDAPPVLFVRGDIQHAGADRFAVAIVGSRDATAYGLEQARRFGGALASAGLTVVSGGARGVDAAAHHGALLAGGRSIAVLGCGVGVDYPPENAELFSKLAANGAVVSELPLHTPPAAENFPARNRLISGLALGVLVIEAGLKSGSLITAKLAAEEHGREVFALPGRVDSAASQGSLNLIKSGGALLVTEPADIIHAVESAARHLAGGTHAVRFPTRTTAGLFEEPDPAPGASDTPPTGSAAIVLHALTAASTFDQLLENTGLEAHRLRAELTLLELSGRIKREGSRFAARS